MWFMSSLEKPEGINTASIHCTSSLSCFTTCSFREMCVWFKKHAYLLYLYPHNRVRISRTSFAVANHNPQTAKQDQSHHKSQQ